MLQWPFVTFWNNGVKEIHNYIIIPSFIQLCLFSIHLNFSYPLFSPSPNPQTCQQFQRITHYIQQFLCSK